MTMIIHLDNLEAYLTRGIIGSLQKYDVALPRDLIDMMVTRIVTDVELVHRQAKTEDPFYMEVAALANFIRQTKDDICALQPGDVNTNHIRVASEELDAIVAATEEAANKIMDVCDEIAVFAETQPPEAKQKLIDCNMRIFEASNFQDITGQRITKVVKALKYIDVKVDTLLKILSGDFDTTHAKTLDVENPLGPGVETLLNGPQLPGQGMDQSNIDALLAGSE